MPNLNLGPWVLVLATLLMLGCAQSEPTAATPTTNIGTSTPFTTTAPPDFQVGGVWQPAPSTSWQWQLNDLPIDHSVAAEMYDIDLFDNDAATVAALHAEGRIAICYVNAGGWENWRPDAGRFPDSVIGSNLDDWEGERWLDIRRIDVLGPIMETRMDACLAKGFDGIEPDNVDGFLNGTGFPLTYDDQIGYNIWLAETAHGRGLSIGLKNDMDQIPDLLPYFDWAQNEECFEFQECETLLPFIEAGKAVFNVEYSQETSQFCTQAKALGFNSMKKNLNLDAWQEPCR
ncbi:MAG: endo alpha-1,4 polygalactosaminidase [SAR202 cluster bacterium]|nr:endo alpha-1,4 polygalactosaminidase [SAR202 cluster bacterium]